MEIGHDPPDLPIGMVTDFHLKRCIKPRSGSSSISLSSTL